MEFAMTATGLDDTKKDHSLILGKLWSVREGGLDRKGQVGQLTVPIPTTRPRAQPGQARPAHRAGPVSWQQPMLMGPVDPGWVFSFCTSISFLQRQIDSPYLSHSLHSLFFNSVTNYFFFFSSVYVEFHGGHCIKYGPYFTA